MKIAFCGDLVLQGMEKVSEEIWEPFISICNREKANICLNLESPFISKGQKPIKNKIVLYSTDDSIKHLKKIKPYLINLANNHVNDYGNESCITTKVLLSKYGFKYFGVGERGRIDENVFIDRSLMLIHVSFATRSCDLTGSRLFADVDFIGPYEVDLEQIKRLKKENEGFQIVVHIHWGIEDVKYPEPEKIKLGHEIIDAGADLIIGHHPHIVQVVEQYKGKYIFFSIGNFYFPEINFFLSGKMYKKKSFYHQRIGIVPIFNFQKEIILEKVIRVERNKSGKKIICREEKVENFFHYTNYTQEWWNKFNRKVTFCRKVKRAINNPLLIVSKVMKLLKI